MHPVLSSPLVEVVLAAVSTVKFPRFALSTSLCVFVVLKMFTVLVSVQFSYSVVSDSL